MSKEIPRFNVTCRSLGQGVESRVYVEWSRDRGLGLGLERGDGNRADDEV